MPIGGVNTNGYAFAIPPAAGGEVPGAGVVGVVGVVVVSVGVFGAIIGTHCCNVGSKRKPGGHGSFAGIGIPPPPLGEGAPPPTAGPGPGTPINCC